MRRYFTKMPIVLGFVAFLAVSCKNEARIISFKTGNEVWDITGDSLVTRTYPSDAPEEMTPTVEISQGAAVSPKSGEKQNFFTDGGVRYTVTAKDGLTKRTYLVKATREEDKTTVKQYRIEAKEELSSLAEITNVEALGVKAIKEKGSDTVFVLALPRGTDLTRLKPKVTFSEGASLSPKSGTEQNFSSPAGAVFTVTSEDKTTVKQYIIKVIIHLSAVAKINSFKVDADINGTVDDDKGTVTLTFPATTVKTVKRLPIIDYEADSIVPDPAIEQNFFADGGITYTLKSEKGTYKTYTVTAKLVKHWASPEEKQSWDVRDRVAVDGKDGFGSVKALLDGDLMSGWRTTVGAMRKDFYPKVKFDMKVCNTVHAVRLSHFPNMTDRNGVENPGFFSNRKIVFFITDNENLDITTVTPNAVWTLTENELVDQKKYPPYVIRFPDAPAGRYLIMTVPEVDWNKRPCASLTEVDVEFE